jgi:hypothetical protein
MVDNATVTLTFGDQAESHVNMQKIGTLAECGFTSDEMFKAKSMFESEGYEWFD